MFPVGFLLVWYKGIKIWICFYYFYFNNIVFSSLIFWGWLLVTYGIDFVSIPRYYILVSYQSQNYGIEPSLVSINHICYNNCLILTVQSQDWLPKKELKKKGRRTRFAGVLIKWRVNGNVHGSPLLQTGLWLLKTNVKVAYIQVWVKT